MLFRIHQPITFDFLDVFTKRISKYQKDDMVVLHFDSAGGDILAVQKMIHLLYTLKVTTIGVAYGRVYSAALPLYVACSYRIAYDTSKFLIHNAYTEKMSVSQIQVSQKEREIFDFIVGRTSLSSEHLYQLAKEDTYLSKTQAVDLGIVTLEQYSKKPLALR